MSPQRHLLCGTILATGILLTKHDTDMAMACLIGSVISDTDHILEYSKYCNEYNVQPSFKEFVSGKYFDTKKTVYVPFHSWEAAFLGILYCLLVKSAGNAIKGLTIGYASHMILDQIGNKACVGGYFWLYRWWKDWKQEFF